MAPLQLDSQRNICVLQDIVFLCLAPSQIPAAQAGLTEASMMYVLRSFAASLDTAQDIALLRPFAGFSIQKEISCQRRNGVWARQVSNMKCSPGQERDRARIAGLLLQGGAQLLGDLQVWDVSESLQGTRGNRLGSVGQGER